VNATEKKKIRKATEANATLGRLLASVASGDDVEFREAIELLHEAVFESGVIPTTVPGTCRHDIEAEKYLRETGREV